MFAETTATRKIKNLTKKIRAVQGGTSASKTISILLYLIARAQIDKNPTLTSIVAESVPHLKRGAIRDFKNILNAHHYWDENCWNATDSIYTFETGSQIEFFSADQSDKLRGGRRDRLFINEANNVTLDAFDQLEVRTREFVFLDWNPTTEFWFYTDVLNERDDVDHIILTYKDNEALDPTTIASIEGRRNRKNWFKVYGEGQLGEVEGRIYTGWGELDEVPEEAKLARFWLDFGYSNDPTSLGAVYSWNGAYVLDDIIYRKGLSNKQIADIIAEQEANVLTVADSSEPKSIDEIKSHGIAIIGAEKGKDSINNGIQIVQDQKIFLTKRSVDTKKEYNNYLWMTDKEGKNLNVPEDIWNHSMDGIRYAITSLVRPPRKSTSVYRPSRPVGFQETNADKKGSGVSVHKPVIHIST